MSDNELRLSVNNAFAGFIISTEPSGMMDIEVTKYSDCDDGSIETIMIYLSRDEAKQLHNWLNTHLS